MYTSLEVLDTAAVSSSVCVDLRAVLVCGV